MRETKFRGKRPNSGKWITGGLVVKGIHCYILGNGHFEAECSTEVLAETVGEYIGIEDNYCYEICEGDILDALEFHSMFFPNRMVVEYHGMAFMFVGKTKNASPSCEYTLDTITSKSQTRHTGLVRVGNIHDNPELLGEVLK